MSPRHLGVRLAFYLCCLALAIPSWGQEPVDPQELANYAFAHYLGTGIYSTSGQAVQVYQMPFSYTLREAGEKTWGVRVLFPVTAGFYDIGEGGLWQEGLPDAVATATLVPGLELQIPLLDNWVLAPAGDYGVAKNFTTGQTVNVYSASVRSRVEFAWGRRRLVLRNRLLYAKHTGESTGGANDFSALETGLDLTHPLPRELFGEQVELGLYAINFRYFDNLTFLRPAKRPVEVAVQNEIGVTLGLVTPREWLFFELSRIGLGVRFGNGLTILRLVIGTPL